MYGFYGSYDYNEEEMTFTNEWSSKKPRIHDYHDEDYKLEGMPGFDNLKSLIAKPVEIPIKKKPITQKSIPELHEEDKMRAKERAKSIVDMNQHDLQIKKEDIRLTKDTRSLPNSREGLKMSFANISLF